VLISELGIMNCCLFPRWTAKIRVYVLRCSWKTIPQEKEGMIHFIGY
jgi:hypothetical protein